MIDQKIRNELLTRPSKPGFLLTPSGLKRKYLARYDLYMSGPGRESVEVRALWWAINFDHLRRITNEELALSTMDRRHEYYGSGPLIATGEVGILVRSIDKFVRYEHMMGKGIEDDEDPLIDAMQDALAYSLLGYCLVRGGLS